MEEHVGRRTRSKDVDFGVGQLLEKKFPGHGVFQGNIKAPLPTSDYPFYFVEYEDGDSEHISIEDMRKYVVLDDPKKESKSQSKSSSAPAPKARPRRKVTLKPRPSNTTSSTAKDIKGKKSRRTKRKSSGGDDDNGNDESPPLKKPAPKSTFTRRPKRTATIKKAPSPIKTKSGRIVKSTTVNIDGFAVKLGNNYEVGAESYEFQRTDSAPPPKKKQAASKANVKAKAIKRAVTEAERLRTEHNTAVKEREETAAVLRREFFADNISCLEKFIDPKMVQMLKSMETNDEVATTGDGPDEVMQPDLIEGELRDYQLIGLNFMIRMFRRGMPMILGDEMGLGKTLQTISLICHLKETEGRTGPSIVVCPLSVLESWYNEIKKWAPSLNVLRLHANSKQLTEIIKKNMANARDGGFLACDVVVTTYDVAKSASTKSLWSRLRFNLCVLDEGHIVKNHQSLISQGVRRIHSEGKLLLSGTPTQNNLVELWAILNSLYPEFFAEGPSYKTFASAFDITKNQVDLDLLNSSHEMLRLFMLRRMKSEVEKLMPKKVETRVLCPLSEIQIELYKGMLLNDINMIVEASQEVATDGTNPEAVKTRPSYKHLANLFMQLRKLCNHPFNIPGVEADPSATTVEEMIAASGKLAVMDMLLRNLFGGGHRVVLFSQFTHNLDLIQDYCELRGWNHCRFDGGTARAKRNHIVRQFNAPDSDIFLFLISTRAGGMGLNLQTADTCILFDSDMNPQQDLQAIARIHRIGQTKTVHVYRLISAGTIEERNVERAQKKLYLDQVVNRDSARATENKSSTAFSADEMLQSLQFGSNAVFGDSNSELNCLPSEEDIRHITDRSRSEDDSMGNLKGGASHTLGDFDASAKLTSSSKLGGIDFQAIREAHWKSGGRKQSEKALITGAQSLAKRQVKSRIIVVKDDDGRDIPVLKSNNYDLENGESSVFDRELSGRKQDGFVEKERTKAPRSGVDFETSDLCQVCGDGDSTAPLSFCTKCPVAYHQDCFADFCDQNGGSQWGERCSHHSCIKCHRGTSTAGGILFPCQSCPKVFCEDCLQSETAIAGHIGTCNRWEDLGFSTKYASYIHCSKECEQFARDRFGWVPNGANKFTLPPAIDVSYAFGKKVTEEVPEPKPVESEQAFEVGTIVDVQARDNKSGGRGRVKSAEFVKYVGWVYSVAYGVGGVEHRIESIYVTSVNEEDDVRKPRNVRKVTYHDVSTWTPTPKKPKATAKKSEPADTPIATTMPVPIFAPFGQYDVTVPMNVNDPLPIALRHKQAPVLFAGWRKSSDVSDGSGNDASASRPKIFTGDILVAVGGRSVSGIPRRDAKRMMKASVEVGCVKLRFIDVRFVSKVISKLSIDATKVMTRAMHSYRSSPAGSIEPELLANAVQSTGLPRDAIINRARQIAEAKARAVAAQKKRLEEEEKMKVAGEKRNSEDQPSIIIAPPKVVTFNDADATKCLRLSDVSSDSAAATSIVPTDGVQMAAATAINKPDRLSSLLATSNPSGTSAGSVSFPSYSFQPPLADAAAVQHPGLSAPQQSSQGMIGVQRIGSTMAHPQYFPQLSGQNRSTSMYAPQGLPPTNTMQLYPQQLQMAQRSGAKQALGIDAAAPISRKSSMEDGKIKCNTPTTIDLTVASGEDKGRDEEGATAHDVFDLTS